MDRAFLEYYEEELTHIRALASEFADMHPAIARNLSLDTVPCPDPYVERLLDGVAFLAARTRLKVDAERSRFTRSVLEVLYPDLVAPAPAVGMAILKPGQQVQTMLAGHRVKRGTRLVSSLQPGLSTRCTYTTGQDVVLWPIKVNSVGYYQDRSALAAAGLRSIGDVAGSRRCASPSNAPARVSSTSSTWTSLDLCFAGRPKAATIFDTLFGATAAVGARIEGNDHRLTALGEIEMVGIDDAEAMMPRTRSTFEGYRLLREYFLMPERFHFARVRGIKPVVRASPGGLDLIFLFRRPAPEMSDITAADFELFATPIINLFERECNVIEIDRRKTRQVVHADRTRPRDFEIYRVTRVEDADIEGPEARCPGALQPRSEPGSGWVYWAERRPRRPGEDERRQGMTRTSYRRRRRVPGLSARPDGRRRPDRAPRIVALCTNRDLPILDDQPALTLESGDPVETVRLLGAVRSPPAGTAGRCRRRGRRVARRRTGLAAGGAALAELPRPCRRKGAAPTAARHARLYADRGDPGARPPRALDRSRRVATGGSSGCRSPGRCASAAARKSPRMSTSRSSPGTARCCCRRCCAAVCPPLPAINGFVQTRTRLLQKQEEVPWPMTPGNRSLV